MARPSWTPWDDIARTALNATGPYETTGLRVAGDLALLMHGADLQPGPGLILVTDQDIEPARMYRLIAAALEQRGWTISPTPTGGPVGWLTMTRDDGLRTTLAIVRQPGLHPALVVNQIPVASVVDCVAAARRAVAARNSPENQARLEAILRARAAHELAAEASAVAPQQPAAGVPHERTDVVPSTHTAITNPAEPADVAPAAGLARQEASRRDLRTEAISLARELAAADLLGLSLLNPVAHQDAEFHLAALLLALQSSSAAAQRAAAGSSLSDQESQRPVTRARRALDQQRVQPAYAASGLGPR